VLEKHEIIDQINIMPTGAIQVRKTITVTDDGVEIGKSYNRYILNPGDSLDGQDGRIVAVANAVWTPEAIADYQASLPTASS
jgi:hypothetical protein